MLCESQGRPILTKVSEAWSSNQSFWVNMRSGNLMLGIQILNICAWIGLTPTVIEQTKHLFKRRRLYIQWINEIQSYPCYYWTPKKLYCPLYTTPTEQEIDTLNSFLSVWTVLVKFCIALFYHCDATWPTINLLFVCLFQ